MSCHFDCEKVVSSLGAFCVNLARTCPLQPQHPLLKERAGVGFPPRACPTESSVNPWLTTTSQAERLALTVGVAGTQIFLRPGPQWSGDAKAHAKPRNWPPVCPRSTIYKVTTGPSLLGTAVIYTCGQGLIISSVPNVFKSSIPVPSR